MSANITPTASSSAYSHSSSEETCPLRKQSLEDLIEILSFPLNPPPPTINDGEIYADDPLFVEAQKRLQNEISTRRGWKVPLYPATHYLCDSMYDEEGSVVMFVREGVCAFEFHTTEDGHFFHLRLEANIRDPYNPKILLIEEIPQEIEGH